MIWGLLIGVTAAVVIAAWHPYMIPTPPPGSDEDDRLASARSHILTALHTLLGMERSFDVEFTEQVLGEAYAALGGSRADLESPTLEHRLAEAVHTIRAREARVAADEKRVNDEPR